MGIAKDLWDILKEDVFFKREIREGAKEFYKLIKGNLLGQRPVGVKRIPALQQFAEQLEHGEFPISMNRYRYLQLLLGSIVMAVEIKNRGWLFSSLYLPDRIIYFPPVTMPTKINRFPHDIKQYFGFATGRTIVAVDYYTYYAIESSDDGYSVESELPDLKKWLDTFSEAPTGKFEKDEFEEELMSRGLKLTPIDKVIYFQTQAFIYAENEYMEATDPGALLLDFSNANQKRQTTANELKDLLEYKPF